MGYKYRYVIKSINDYLNIIKQIQTNEKSYTSQLWFRGQSRSEDRLNPKGLRNTVPAMNSYGYKIDRPSTGYGDYHIGPNIERMLSKFKQKAIPFLNYMPRNEFEWMFIAQHYGLPTRLLDWTDNPLVALYFAIYEAIPSDIETNMEDDIQTFLNNNEYINGGAAVHVMNPSSFNNLSCGINEPIDISAQFERWKMYVNPTLHGVDAFLPIAILGNHIDQRIRAQSGHFTLHGSNIWPLDYYIVFEDVIHKIFIPYDVIDSLLEELKLLGITHSFIYPEISSIVKDITEDEYLRFWRGYQSGEISLGIDE